ncbi:nucleotidyltransferase domain-containing protein [Candidatus Aerophobetes bacterium]|nr:nucleotidyltransferase domain-containing protein [Candidatus Aerophobetes bacterium]
MIRELVQQALDFCTEKNPYLEDRQAVVGMLLKDDSWTHSVFRYALAIRISQYLGAHYQELKQVYLVGSTLENRAKFTSDIDLIIRVESDSKAVVNTLRRVDNDIMIYYRSLLGDEVKKMYKILDLEFVFFEEEKKLKKIKGWVFHPPLLVWHQ